MAQPSVASTTSYLHPVAVSTKTTFVCAYCFSIGHRMSKVFQIYPGQIASSDIAVIEVDPNVAFMDLEDIANAIIASM